MTQKSIKRSVIAEYLAYNPLEEYQPLDFHLPDEDILAIEEDDEEVDNNWKMYFNGASNVNGNGIGAVIVSPEGKQFPIALRLEFDCTNNIA